MLGGDMTFDYDLFVIGGGSGGVRAARLAASEAGQKVGLAEEYRMGGTCVIRGCVPKKLMVYASEFPGLVHEAREFGWDARIGDLDWGHFRGKLHAELDRLESIYRRNLAAAGVHIHDARAHVLDPHTVELSTGARLTAKHILIAVGGRPVKPAIEGAELGLTSNDVFHLEALPKRMLIIGGGYIASEFAGIMNGLGVRVTQYYRGTQILRGFDQETVEHVAQAMRARGVDLQTGVNATKLTKSAGGILVDDTNGGQHEFDQVMFATGRVPNTDGLGLEGAGVALGDKGQVLVDEYSATKVPSIFAVGDVTDRIQLTPVAIREGAAFVETVFHGRPTAFDHDLVASAVFTQPEMGTVGQAEEEARANGPVQVYTTSFKSMRGGFAGGDEKVFMKLVVCQASRRVLGCHIVGDHAGEIIQLAGIAVKMGATKEQFDTTCAVHPTMAEELVTMKTPVRQG
jgi:glutathione reductase (NADPH)